MEQEEILKRVKLIDDYINRYNDEDIDGMLELMDGDIEFKNISHGETTESTKGKHEFKLVAENSKSLFSHREQKIENISLSANGAQVDIVFSAVMAISTPDGLRAGEKISFKGSSNFTFNNGKISKIHDIS